MPTQPNLRPVAGTVGYWVSDDGRLFSEWNRYRDEHGHIRSRRGELKQNSTVKGSHGYHVIQAGRKRIMLSRAILTAFVGPPPDEKMCACHNDGNKDNNNLSNLRWDTRAGNEADKVRHGTSNRGTRNGQNRLSEEQVLAIRARYAEFPITQMGTRRTKPFGSMKLVAEEFCLPLTTVKSVLYYNWKHLP